MWYLSEGLLSMMRDPTRLPEINAGSRDSQVESWGAP